MNEREKYLRALKIHKISVIALRISILILFLLVWELFSSCGIIDSFFFSSPSRIIKLFISMDKSSLLKHIGITLFECICAFTISMCLAMVLAVLLWWSDFLRKILDPYIVIINSLPKIALGPLIIIWVGIGKKAIITMGVLICIIVALTTMLSGFISADPDKIFLLRSMGATKLQILTKLVIPSALPSIVSALKVTIGLAWVGTIMGEYLVSGAGLGYLIIYGGAVFKLDLVMLSTVILCILAGAMYAVVSFIEKIVIKTK
ncbi:MAG: ABC transporter permease [Clostridiales bacterium]|nr:ABC transporter permease [Clostridiales bacterium]